MFNYKKKHLTNTKHKIVVELSALNLHLSQWNVLIGPKYEFFYHRFNSADLKCR